MANHIEEVIILTAFNEHTLLILCRMNVFLYLRRVGVTVGTAHRAGGDHGAQAAAGGCKGSPLLVAYSCVFHTVKNKAKQKMREKSHHASCI